MSRYIRSATLRSLEQLINASIVIWNPPGKCCLAKCRLPNLLFHKSSKISAESIGSQLQTQLTVKLVCLSLFFIAAAIAIPARLHHKDHSVSPPLTRNESN